MPIVLLAAGLVTFIAIGVAGASVIERYLAVPALALMVLAAVAIGGWTMLLPGWVRTAGWSARSRSWSFGVAYTATHLNLSRFDNELRFRGQAHDDLTEVLNDPKVKAGLRCGPLTGPNHKIVPDTRWIADLGDGQVRARAESYRDDRDVPLPTKGVAIVVTSRFAIFKHAWTDAADDAAHPGPAARLHARQDDALLRRLCPLLATAGSRFAWPCAIAGDRSRSPPRLLGRGARRALRARSCCARRPEDRPAVRLQRRRERHFVPRAIGMFGHGRNPDYFINPPAFTYVAPRAVHASAGGRTRRPSAARSRPTRPTAFAMARAASRVPRRARRPADRDRRRAAVRGPARRRSSRARCSRSRSCPSTTATSRSTTRPRWRRWRAALVGVAGIYRTGRTREYVLAGRRARASRSRPSTRPGSCSSRSSRRRSRRRSRTPASRNLAFAFALDVRRVPGRQPVRAAGPPRVPRRPARSRPTTAGEDGGKLGLAQHDGLALLPADVHLGPRLAAVAVRARRRRRADRAPPAARRSCSRPRRSCCSSTSATSRASSRAGCCRSTRSCACWRPGRSSRWRPRARAPRALASPRSPRSCCCRALVFSVHNDLVLAKADTRQVARDWMVAQHPDRARRSSSSRSRPTSGRWTPGHPLFGTRRRDRLRQPLEQVARRRARASSTASDRRRGACPVVKLEDYERTTRPAADQVLRRRRLLLGGHRLDAVRARVRRPARGAGRARATTTSSSGAARWSSASSPYGGRRAACRSRSTTRSTTTRSTTSGPGPEIVIYRICMSANCRRDEARGRHRRRLRAARRRSACPNLIVWLGGRAPVTQGRARRSRTPRRRSCSARR